MQTPTLFIPLILFTIITTSSQTYEQFSQQTPLAFGLYLIPTNLTPTQLNKILHNYAMMECQLINQIYVDWRQGSKPEEVGVVRDDRWVRPVLFGVGDRDEEIFGVDQGSQASVYFMMQNEVVISCQQLHKTFKLWQQKSTQSLGPLLSYSTHSYDFTTPTQTFTYSSPPQSRFFTIADINGCWVSKFYLQMLASKNIWEINQMREVWRKRRACGGLVLNFVVAYFFGMGNGAIGGEVGYKGEQEDGQSVVNQKSQCIRKFTEILGYNPLRLINKADPPNSQRFSLQKSTLTLINYLKKLQIQSLLEATPQSVPSLPDTSLSSSTQQHDLKEQLLKLKINIGQVQLKYKELMGKLEGNGNQSKEIEERKEMEGEIGDEEMEELNRKLEWIVRIGVFVLGVVCLMVVYVMISYFCFKCKPNPKNTTSTQSQKKLQPKQKPKTSNIIKQKVESSSDQQN